MDDEYILLISFDFDGLNRFCNSCRLLFCIVLHEESEERRLMQQESGRRIIMTSPGMSLWRRRIIMLQAMMALF